MSPLRGRREGVPDDALVVVRGGELDVESLRSDALRTFRRFGDYGVSVLAAPTQSDLDELAHTVLVRWEVLVLMTAGAIRTARLELRPTFRRPHYTIMLPELDRDVVRLARCDNERYLNPYARPEEVT